jgi:L-amino acid N-acyltransferase
VIRDARGADAGAVAALWNHFIRDTLVTFNFAEKSAKEVAGMIASRQEVGHGFLVAEEGGRLAGFATYGQFRSGIGYARTMEHTILLREEARGRGIGRALMSAVEEHARAGGAHSIFAGVSSGNPAGRAFHAAVGYTEVAVLREVGRKWDRWLDLHIMQKVL